MDPGVDHDGFYGRVLVDPLNDVSPCRRYSEISIGIEYLWMFEVYGVPMLNRGQRAETCYPMYMGRYANPGQKGLKNSE